MREDNLIQELIETKSFNELSEEEKGFVLVHISEEEFSMRRKLIENMRVFLNQEVIRTNPDENARLAAVRLLEGKKNHKVTLVSLITWRVPAYVPIAAMLILFFAIRLTGKGEESNVKYIAGKTDTVHRVVYKTDTVVLEKEVIKQKKVPVVKYVDMGCQPASSNFNGNQGTDRVVRANPEILIQKTREQLEKQVRQNGLASQEMNTFKIDHKKQIFTWN